MLNIPTTGHVQTKGCEALSSSSLGGSMSDLNTKKTLLITHQT